MLIALFAASLGLADAPNHLGCLGQPVEACISALRETFDIEQADVDRALRDSLQVDVNGRRINTSGVITLLARPSGSSVVANEIITIGSAPDGGVRWAEFGLRSDPGLARTENEYAATGLGQAVSVIFPDDTCTNALGVSLFRFFENEVKPTISRGLPSRSYTWDRASELSTSRSRSVSLCGVLLSYSVTSGHSTGLISRYNSSGSLHQALVRFTLP